MIHRRIVVIMLLVTTLTGCASIPTATPPTIPTETQLAPVTLNPTIPAFDPATYTFPESIDSDLRYMFYLHGKIIEDQGLPAVSLTYGAYEYPAILEALSAHGFVVISEQRAQNTDGLTYAHRVTAQVESLIDAGVPAHNITIVGASKGAGIAIYVSHLLENSEVNYVLMAICHPDVVANLKQEGIFLSGNVLSIYDSVDEYAGSCQELFSFSEGRGLASYDEIVLEIGTGHGILYQPLDAWITPAVQWAAKL